MPKTNTKGKKAVKVIKPMRKTPSLIANLKFNPILLVKILLIVSIGIVVFLLLQKNRNLILVGTVNKSPIYRWELNQKMSDKYGQTTLEEIISERILEENLKKYKIVITDKEVADELASIKEQYGGEEQFLAAIEQYAMTEEQAEESIKQSLGLKKLIESQNKIEITDEQVKTYFEENKTSFTGKTLDQVSAEIKDSLYQQEIYTRSQEWYTQVRNEAKVNSYL